MISEFLSALYYWFKHCQRNNGEEDNQIREEDPSREENEDID